MKNLFLFFLFAFYDVALAQTIIHVNANDKTTPIPPIWRDHYENHFLEGYGGNPALTGNHRLYTTDPSFYPAMEALKPRFIRISIGRVDNPSTTNYSSTNTNILRNLKYEFYKGRNTMVDANDLSNYNFSFIDSAISQIQSLGAEPFITMDYMPFTLSRDTTPEYQAAMALIHNLAYDNSIRNAPPSNNAVYGRVMYHFIKHCYQKFGVKYFEHWNEPDQQWLNPIIVKFFWKGDEHELYYAYAAIAKEVSEDPLLSSNVKLGGCSFAFYSILNLMPLNFLNHIQTNKTKFDFLSFHPYSDNQYKGGYDTSKVNLAIQWRDKYAPNAELINAEWGRLEPNSSAWGDLDYGLDKFRHIIDMLNKGISMSHETCLFDADTSSTNFSSLGMFRVGPIVPKPSAFVFYNLNKLNTLLNRIPVNINNRDVALACMANNKDKILIAFPADNPTNGTNTIDMTVSNLPWGNSGYYLYRYELTEQSYIDGIIYNLTYKQQGVGDTVSDKFNYSSVHNSGRLIIWEISPTPLDNSDFIFKTPKIIIYPNPCHGKFCVKSQRENIKIKSIKICNMLGEEIWNRTYPFLQSEVCIDDFTKFGSYFIAIETNNGMYNSKFVSQ